MCLAAFQLQKINFRISKSWICNSKIRKSRICYSNSTSPPTKPTLQSTLLLGWDIIFCNFFSHYILSYAPHHSRSPLLVWFVEWNGMIWSIIIFWTNNTRWMRFYWYNRKKNKVITFGGYSQATKKKEKENHENNTGRLNWYINTRRTQQRRPVGLGHRASF